ncbi:hypothetical protein ABPG72_012388 [Tetrahymena utriculariae]
MIRLKKDRLFVNLLQFDKQQLIEQKIISEDDFIFQKGNEEQLNLYLSLALLTSCNYLPADRVVDLMYEIIEDNFVLDKIDIMELIRIIRQVGEFSLHDEDLLYIELVIKLLFSKKDNQLYQSSLILPSITFKKAKQKALDLIDKMHTHLEKYNQIQELESNSQAGLQNSNGSSVSSSKIQKKQKNFLSFNFKIYQKKKECENQTQNTFPQILDGIFQRKVVLQLFSDESKQLIRFPNKIEEAENERQREIQLPEAFRKYMKNGGVRRGVENEEEEEEIKENLERREGVQNPQNLNSQPIQQKATIVKSEEEQKQNIEDNKNFAINKISEDPKSNSQYSSEQNENKILQEQLKNRVPNNAGEFQLSYKEAQDLNSLPQILDGIIQRQAASQLFPDNNQMFNNKIEEADNNKRSREIEFPEALKKFMNNGIGQNSSNEEEEKKENFGRGEGVQNPQNLFSQLPNNAGAFRLSDEEVQGIKLKLRSASQKRQEKQVQPQSSLELVNQQMVRNQYERLQKFDLSDSQVQQNLTYFQGKQWNPIYLIDCRSYYKIYQNKEQQEQLERKLNIDMMELNKVLKQVWDNIYDICFKAIYFANLINSQSTDELKSFCEYYILKNYLEVRQRQEKQFFQNCQNMVYVAVLLLQYFNNETFYKIYVGAILNQLENLVIHQAYEFNYNKLNPYQQELFLCFQMLLLFDNPQYFEELFAHKNKFVLRLMNIYKKECYDIKTDIKSELDFLMNFKLSNQQNQFQKTLCDDYFNLILHNEHDELAYYMLAVQVMSNNQSIIDVEEFISKETQKQQKQEDYITWTESIAQVKALYGEIFSISNQTHSLVKTECIPKIPNISLVNLQNRLKEKMNQNICNNFIEEAFFQNLKSLKLYQTNKCPNFSLNFIPPDIFGCNMRNKLFEVVEILKKMKSGNIKQQEQYKQEALILYQEYFGLNTDKMIDKLKNITNRSDLEEEKDKYFPVIFYEYFEQILQKQM